MIDPFSHLIGNEPIKAYLKRMVAKQAIANSLLFAGPDGIGKSLFAQALATLLICQNDPQGIHRKKIEHGNHPDIHHYRPEGKLGMHSMQALRQLSEEIYFPPYEADWKIFIIHEADRMLTYSANALLKTFEEPPANTVIILLSSHASALLPTILSRCSTIHFQPIEQEQIETFLTQRYQLEASVARKIANFAGGSLAQAVHLAEQGGHPSRDDILKAFVKGKFTHYKEFLQFVHTLAEQVETTKKQVEEAAKDELYKVPLENLSAQQQHTLEKELEGAIATCQAHIVQSFLDVILSWYRDLHLLLLGGNRQLLINIDYESDIEQVVQVGEIMPLEQVQKVVEEARLALQRSMGVSMCLENLFLKLNLI